MATIPINYIELREGIAYIIGTSVKVAVIVSSYVYADSSIEWISENYDLTPAQVHTALAYYYDHPTEINRQHHTSQQLAQKIGTALSDKIEQLRQSKHD